MSHLYVQYATKSWSKHPFDIFSKFYIIMNMWTKFQVEVTKTHIFNQCYRAEWRESWLENIMHTTIDERSVKTHIYIFIPLTLKSFFKWPVAEVNEKMFWLFQYFFLMTQWKGSIWYMKFIRVDNLFYKLNPQRTSCIIYDITW